MALTIVAAITATGAGESLVWYTIRGTGIIAYLLLTLSVVAGLLMTNKALPAGQPRVDLFDLHSFTALLALIFSGVHGLALLLDTYIGFTPAQLVIPLRLITGPSPSGLASSACISPSAFTPASGRSGSSATVPGGRSISVAFSASSWSVATVSSAVPIAAPHG